MKKADKELVFSEIDLSILKTLQQLEMESTFQLAEKLPQPYDKLLVMRSLHSLLRKELLIRFNVKGERYYSLNNRNSATIKKILWQSVDGKHTLTAP